jgi:hypothetical protein
VSRSSSRSLPVRISSYKSWRPSFASAI